VETVGKGKGEKTEKEIRQKTKKGNQERRRGIATV
jgi:hypothetical protein